MTAPQARAAYHPVLSSPKHLSFVSLGVTLVVYAIQLASGVPPWLSWSPVEVSSNVVAMAGLLWTALQLRASWSDENLRRVWLAGSIGMALLSVEDHVGELFTLESHGQDEMSLSILMWLVAAWLIFKVGRRFAMRRSVVMVMRFGLLIQLVSQLIGLWAAYGDLADPTAEFLDYVNDTGELFAVLAYLMALLLAVFSPNKSYDFPLTAIGRKGREMLRDLGLNRKRRKGAGEGLVATACAIATSWIGAARAVHREGGPAPMRQLLDLSRCGFVARIDPESYYLLELFRAKSIARTIDAIVSRAETRAGLTASVQDTRRPRRADEELNDRIAFARRCTERGVPVVATIAFADGGAWRPVESALSSYDRDLTIRSRRRSSCDFRLSLRREEPLIYRDDAGGILNIDMAVSRLAAASRTGGIVVNPMLKDHEDVARYARSGRVVFRVVTCLDENDEPRVTHGVMRLIQDGGQTPAEWGAAIDLGTGVFGELGADSASACTSWSYGHPETNEMIAGRICAGWPDIADAAVAAHRAFSGHVVVGWDIAWTADGPMLLDGDPDMDFAFIQRCYGTPLGWSPLAGLLDRHLDRVLALHL